MNRIVKILSVLFLALTVVSCSDRDDSLFDKSSAERLDQTLEEAKTVLTSSSNGWVMKMFPSPDQRYGGYNILLKFDADGLVDALNDLSPDESSKAQSYYDLNNSNGPCLTFNTYNSQIHFFSEPANSYFHAKRNVSGDGDYVFRIVSVSPDKVVLKGLRSESIAELEPIKEGTSWSDYLTQIHNMKSAVKGLSYTVFVDGKEVEVSKDDTYPVFHLANGVDLSYVCTTDGIELYKPLTMDGVSFQKLTYSTTDDQRRWISEDTRFVLRKNKLSLYDLVTKGKWYMKKSTAGEIGAAAIDQVHENAQGVLGQFNFNLKHAYLGYDVNEGTEQRGFAVWAELEGVNLPFVLKFPVLLEAEPVEGNPSKITISGGNISPDIVDVTPLAKPFIIFADEENNVEAGSRTFTITSDDEYSPTVITLTEDGGNNIIELYTNTIDNPREK